MKTYKITASTPYGGVEKRGVCLDYKGDGWNEPWKADNSKDNESFASIADAVSTVDRERESFDSDWTLEIYCTEIDDDGELIDEGTVYSVPGTIPA